jgi:hypothetical protein
VDNESERISKEAAVVDYGVDFIPQNLPIGAEKSHGKPQQGKSDLRVEIRTRDIPNRNQETTTTARQTALQFFWDVTQCSLVGKDQFFGGTCYLQHGAEENIWTEEG